MRRKMILGVAFATVIIFTLLMALPALTAPVKATSIPTVNNKLSGQSIPLPSGWDNNTKSFFTNMMMVNLTNDLMSANFTHEGIANSRFGLEFANLTEFNDSNSNGRFDQGIDNVLKTYSLTTDVFLELD
ncbi:MAG: hypothetical protein WED07_01880 [Candidatus Freyarchaeum deiterrae]